MGGKSPDFAVISGNDELTTPLMSLGARGVISVAANAFPAAVSGMVRAALGGDFTAAARMQLALMPLIDALFAEGNPAGVKAALSALGIAKPCVRLPLVRASAGLVGKIEGLAKVILK